MATLELAIERAMSPSARCRGRAGSGRCSGRRRLDRLHSGRRDLRQPAAAAQPDRHGHAGARAAPDRAALARHRRARPGRTGAADLWRADIAHGRALRAGDRPRHRRRARHAGGLFPRPVRNLGGRRHGRAAGLSAAGPGAGRHRLSRAVDRSISPDSRRARHSRLHAGGARGHADAGAARIRDRRARARRDACAHPAARAAAQRAAAAARLLPARRRRHHRRRRGAVVPRARRAAAGAELGQHDRRGPREPRHRAPARLHSRRRDVPDRALLQPHRRYAARADRSASGAL